MLVKVSILMLYHRMARGRPFFRYATLILGAIVLLNGTVLMLLNIFQCRPVAAAFNNQDFNQAHCIDIISLFLCSSPITVITDIAILIIPLPMVTSMRLEMRQKVGLIATFITGLFVTIVDVIRIAYLQEALIQVQNPNAAASSGGVGHVTGSIPDFAWHASYSLMWSAVEVNVGLTCACALVIKPLLVRIIPWGSHKPAGSTSFSPGGSMIRSSMSRAPPDHGALEETAVFPAHLGEQYTPDDDALEEAAVFPGHLGAQCPPEIDRDVRIDETFPTPLSSTFPNGLDAIHEEVQRLPSDVPTVGHWQHTGEHRRTSATRSLLHRLGREGSAAQSSSPPEPTTFMDFVNLGDRKPLTRLTAKEAWWPVAFGELSYQAGFSFGSLTGRTISFLVLLDLGIRI